MQIILQLQEAKRAGIAVLLGKPNGRGVTVGEFVRSWRALQGMPADCQVGGWSDFPEHVGEVLRAIRRGVMDRVNLRQLGFVAEGGVNLGRIRRQLERKVRLGVMRCECRWCGQPLGGYVGKEQRFCEASCRRAYYG